MNEKIMNELTEQGYSIVNDAFSSSEFENFRAIIKQTPFSSFDVYKNTYQGMKIPIEELETVKAVLNGKLEKTVLEHTLKQFEKTAFFAENLNGYENNGWNAFRVNFPNERFKNVAWHQDIQTPIENSVDISDRKFLTFWIPFSDVDESNSIEILKMKNENRVYSNHYRHDLPLPKKYRSNERHKMKISAGDLVVIDNFTFHRSVQNVSKFTRVSVDLRYSSNNRQDYKLDFGIRYRLLKNKIRSIVK